MSNIDQMRDQLSDVKEDSNIGQALRQAIKCKICTNIPPGNIIVGVCCGQVIGCTLCVDEWAKQESSCMLCRQAFVPLVLKGFSGVQQLLK